MSDREDGARPVRAEMRSAIARAKDRRTITVLFADVVDSTKLIAEGDPEHGARILIPTIEALAAIAERFGGTVSHRLGDGLVVLFGVPLALEDHALRACHAALAMQEQIVRAPAIRQQNIETALRIRIGINSGLVVTSTTTDGAHTDHDATGPTVHLASRVESQAPPGGIALSEATYLRVRNAFECQSLGHRPLKGFAEPRPLYQLVRPKPVMTGTRGDDAYRVGAPFIGRRDLLEAITRRAAELTQGRGGVVVVTGEAGIGKSRLLSEVQRNASPAIRWYVGHSLSFGQRLSYWPFVEILRAAIGLSEIEDEAANWQRLVDRCVELFAEDADEVVPYLATLFNWQIRAPYAERVRYLEAEALGAQIMRAVWRLVQRLAANGPLVLVIEDLHWIDGSSAALLEHLLPLCGQTWLLVCVLSRPDEEPLKRLLARVANLEGLACDEIRLAPLTALESRDMIGHFVGGDGRIDRISNRILYKAEGNPFFLEEVIRALIDAKVLVRDAGASEWSVRDHDVAIPDTIQGVIMARIDRLDERLRGVLGVAAVIGRTFLYRVLRAVDEQDANLDDRLQILRAIELIEELRSAPELEFVFHHALAQQTIYESLLLDTRQKLHDRVAACLESLFADRSHEIASLLAHHYARAENWPKALDCLLKAAEQSSQIAADDEALLHYEEALTTYTKVLGGKWDRAQRATILRRLAEIYFRRGDPDQGRQHLETALSLYGDRLPAHRLERRWMIFLDLLRQLRNRLFPSSLVRRPGSEISADTEAWLLAYEVVSWISNFTDQEELFRSIVRSLNMSDETGFAEGQAKASAGFGYALDQIGLSRFSTWYFARAQEVIRKFDNPASAGMVCMLSAVHELVNGSWDRAFEFWERAVIAAKGAGDLTTWSIATIQRSFVLVERGHLLEALVAGDELSQVGRESGFHLARRAGALTRGAALRRLGQVDAARDSLDEAVSLSAAAHDAICVAVGKGELGQLLLDRGCHGEAVALLRDAMRTLHRGRTTLYIRALPHAVHAETLVCMLLSSSGGGEHAMLGEAGRACRRALALGNRYKQGFTQALRVRGMLELAKARPARAVEWYRRSLDAGERLGARYEVAKTKIRLGMILQDSAAVTQGEQALVAMGCRSSVSFDHARGSSSLA